MIRPAIPIHLLLLLIALCTSSGCRYLARQQCAQIDTRIADAKPQVDPNHCFGSVNSDFGGVVDLDSSPPFSLQEFLDGQSVALELEQCCCIAAINAPIADAIDKERKAACCTIGYNGCLDRFLAGQALQQRNQAAATAGELFLKLVEIHLQKDLIKKSFTKLDELREASRFASEQGFATDEADKELDANKISLNRKLLEIEKNQLEITTKLSAILGIQRGCLKIVEPIFDLFPVYEEVCLKDEVCRALNERPDLASLSNHCGGLDPECYQILSQLDPRLGIGIVSRIRKLVLLQRLFVNNGSAQQLRQQQLQKLKAARQDLVRVQVSDAIIDIESGYRKLVLENEDLNRLRGRMQALETAAELDPQESYVESVQNWIEQQTVRSQRITAAIDYEIAKIKLIEATGKWIDICGIPRPAEKDCSD